MRPTQKKRILTLATLAIGIVALATTLVVATPASAAKQEKVTICHVPPGNPDNAHTIIVGAPSVPAHLAHGDFVGACDDDDDGGDDGD